MDDPKTRFIEAAVRTISGNTESRLAVSRFLEDRLEEGGVQAEQAIKRWDELDALRRFPIWRITLFGVLLAVSAIVLTKSYSEWQQLRSISKSISAMVGGAILSEEEPLSLGKKSLTADERLILFGDETQSSKTGKAKAIWDRHPDSPAYFAQYAEAFLSENEKLPDDFLDTARRLDPENAWFLYLAAGVEARDCVKKKDRSAEQKAAGKAPEWEILNAGSLGEAMRLFHEARNLKNCDGYKSLLMREKIPLLAQDNKIELFGAVGYVAGTSASDLISLRKLGEAISAQAGHFASENGTTGFRELMADSEAFNHKVLSMESNTLVEVLVYRAIIVTACRGFAGAAKVLGLQPEAERYQAVDDRLREARESLKNRDLLIDGHDFKKKAGIFEGLTTPMVHRQVVNPPPITDEDLKPGRLLEHEIISMLCACAVYMFLGGFLGLVWISGFFRKTPIRRLAARFESLMRPIDWMWVIGAGVVLPILLVMILNRHTPLGGRDFSVVALRFLPPLASFNGLGLLLLILPILIIRWRLSEKCGSFGLVWRHSWIGWIAAGSCLPHMMVAGYAAPLGMIKWVNVAALILLVPHLWLVAVGIRACFVGPTCSLMSATVARMLVPTYASAMLLMIGLVPVFKACEAYWFRREAALVLDAKFPGMGTYEYKVAVQLQKETRAQLEGVVK
ncbi:hypothetical protein JIN84_07850 [Luteolibacter yonseiensis]|uniref:Uncharacterized protein n=1 Tax=Luteolibacter yonseiensis TaxID=1144680 RepID=A0A934QZD6_9BACT|nr:hypothetical protein [Luteolibacter yonseiensis]MBK1815523.1 hypothetical protein [Luteolibacter yonseiensis]